MQPNGKQQAPLGSPCWWGWGLRGLAQGGSQRLLAGSGCGPAPLAQPRIWEEEFYFGLTELPLRRLGCYGDVVSKQIPVPQSTQAGGPGSQFPSPRALVGRLKSGPRKRQQLDFLLHGPALNWAFSVPATEHGVRLGRVPGSIQFCQAGGVGHRSNDEVNCSGVGEAASCDSRPSRCRWPSRGLGVQGAGGQLMQKGRGTVSIAS